MNNNSRTGIKKRIRTTVISGMSVMLSLSAASCSLDPASLISRQGQNNAVTQAQEILIPVTRGTISSELSYVGNLQYNQSADMTWKTGGVIEKVNVHVGDHVKNGDILAVLAADSLNASVILAEKTMIEQQEKLEDVLDSASNRMQAYVTLNAKESALVKAKLEQEALYYPRATREEMERAWDSFALANLNFNYAKQDYDYLVSINEPWEGFEEPREIRFGRMRIVTGGDSRSGRERKFEDYVSTYNTLVSAYEKYVWTSGQPSATDYAVAEGNVEVAQMEYDKALEEYLSYENLPREKDVQAAEAGLKNAETNFNQRFIIAQFDGTVTSLTAVEGYYVTRGSAALRLDDKSRIFIPISIPELDISFVENGRAVSITLDAIPGETFSGHLYTIADASAVSGNTTAFSAMVQVDDPDDRMLAGMTAEISMTGHENKNALLIPNTAVTYTDGKPYVTVVNGTEHEQLEISLGIVSDNVTEVTSGNLQQDALLVVSSISEAALTQLGLDPSLYLNNGQMREQFPAMDQFPEKPSGVQNAVPGPKPDGKALPADDPQQLEVPEPAAAVTLMPEEKPSFEEKEQPEKDEGEFPAPPEGRQSPKKDENGESPTGQRPGGREGSQFLAEPDSSRGNGQFFPGGGRPERPEGGASPRHNEILAVPTAVVDSSGEEG